MTYQVDYPLLQSSYESGVKSMLIAISRFINIKI